MVRRTTRPKIRPGTNFWQDARSHWWARSIRRARDSGHPRRVQPRRFIANGATSTMQRGSNALTRAGFARTSLVGVGRAHGGTMRSASGTVELHALARAARSDASEDLRAKSSWRSVSRPSPRMPPRSATGSCWMTRTSSRTIPTFAPCPVCPSCFGASSSQRARSRGSCRTTGRCPASSTG